MRSPAGYVALVLAGIALFVALGGPAYAAKTVRQISGKSIKAKSITSKQFADGSVTLAKIAASARTSLKGAAGATGPTGQTGTKGAVGGTGPVGGLSFVDAQGRRIGGFGGFISTIAVAVLDSGAELLYDANPANDYPLILNTGPLYYKAAGCAGQPYLQLGSFPVQFAVVLETPPAPGSTIYTMKAATPQAFTAQSRRAAAGCTNASLGVADMLPAQVGGTVPTAQKPLTITPAS